MKSKNSIEMLNQIIGYLIVLIVLTSLAIFVGAITWKIFMWIVSL